MIHLLFHTYFFVRLDVVRLCHCCHLSHVNKMVEYLVGRFHLYCRTTGTLL